MGANKLYKYLDAQGGLMMLLNSNLQFTNATQLNDPFDCHPVYRDLSQVSIKQRQGLPGDVYSELIFQKGMMQRDKSYICSLSKVHDSITMWSYYSKHSGVCIGLNMENVRKHSSRMLGFILGCPELEVDYRDVVHDPISMNDSVDWLRYHFATKAKDWQYEQEVRLLAYDPSPRYMRIYEVEKSICEKVKNLLRKKKGRSPIDWKTIRAYLDVGGECFESVYLGVNIADKAKRQIVDVARKCNPKIKIYQMKVDPKAFALKGEIID